MTKELYIRKHLAPMIKALDAAVEGVTYDAQGEAERVGIFYLDGMGIYINVSGDSLAALTMDVLDKLAAF